MPRPLNTFLLILLFVGCLGGAALLQHRNIEEELKSHLFKFDDSIYLPSSEYARVLAVGYDQSVADFLWLGMIQTFASAWSSPKCPPVLQKYFRVISDLDPRFVAPYSFAIMGVGEEGRRNDYVKEIVEKSVYKLPGNSYVTYQGAFYANWNMDDQELAKYYLHLAKLDPNYPPFIERWEGFFDIKQGRFRAAYEKYLTDYIQALISDNKDVSRIVSFSLQGAVDKWFISEIRSRATDWEKEKRVYPSIEELNAAGRFKGVELPDMLLVKKVITQIEAAPLAERRGFDAGKITAFIQQSVHAFDTLPTGPYIFLWPEDTSYTIWRDMPPSDSNFILSALGALNVCKSYAFKMDMATQAYKQSHHGVLPANPKEIVSELPAHSPFNEPWSWDPKTGAFGIAKYPDLTKVEFPDI